MKPEPLSPTERTYLRDIINSEAGRKWAAILINMRPPIGGRTNEERSISASEAVGYEKAVSNMALILEDAPPAPEVRAIDIRTD